MMLGEKFKSAVSFVGCIFRSLYLAVHCGIYLLWFITWNICNDTVMYVGRKVGKLWSICADTTYTDDKYSQTKFCSEFNYHNITIANIIIRKFDCSDSVRFRECMFKFVLRNISKLLPGCNVSSRNIKFTNYSGLPDNPEYVYIVITIMYDNSATHYHDCIVDNCINRVYRTMIDSHRNDLHEINIIINHFK